MSVEETDPKQIADQNELGDEVENDDIDTDDELRLDRRELTEQGLGRDIDEVEADEQLLLDRKELRELGLELDNPEGFADE
jgi:hypothetical protein